MAQAIDARLRGVALGLAIAGFAGAAPAAGPASGAGPAEFSLELAAGSERSNNPDAFIDDFDVLRPNGRRIARESTFTNLLALAELEWPRGEAGAWLFNAEAELHQSHRVPDFNRRNLALQAGSVLEAAGGELELSVLTQQLVLGDEFLRRRSSGLRGAFSAGDEIMRHRTSLEWLRDRYDSDNDLYDADRLQLRHRRRQILAQRWKPVLQLEGGLALERNRWHFEDLSSREVRLGLGLDLHPRDAVEISLRATRRRSRFGAPTPDEDHRRTDYRTDLSLGASVQLSPHHSFGCDASRSRRTSNDPLAEASLSRFDCTLTIEL